MATGQFEGGNGRYTQDDYRLLGKTLIETLYETARKSSYLEQREDKIANQ